MSNQVYPSLASESVPTPRRAGFVVPSVNTIIEDDLRRVMPSSVGCYIARVFLGQGSQEEVLALRDANKTATRSLMDAKVGLVAFTCTAGSMIGGPTYDAAILDDIVTAGVPNAVTTAAALIEALSAFGASSITLISPHQGPLHDIEAQFFKSCGFRVTSSGRLNLGHPNQLSEFNPEHLIQEISSLLSEIGSLGEAIVLSCANMRALEAIPKLEQIIGIPVLASNQAMIWSVLHRLGISHSIEALGRLGAIRTA